ncbi:MAG: UDP-N-acetylmuramoyl-tripeptide--D-alanyl-D-alanine ligase [Oscillospiraceae bacterium]
MKMKQLTVERIAQVTGGEFFGPRGLKNDRITGVSTDSRDVEKGGLFVCIKGARVDGHSFAPMAVKERGALCCLSEEPLGEVPHILVKSTTAALRELAAYYRTLFHIPVVGIVGSVGKTTAKEMTAAVLSRKFNVLKTPANLNNEIGVPLTLLSLREEHEAAVIEMGISDFGEMRRLAKMVRPDICVMTAIGYCHLEKLGDLEGVLKAKSEVFEYMEPDAVAVLNGDDGYLQDFDPGVRRVTYGICPGKDIWAENVENLGFDGISCDICDGQYRVFTLIPAFGTHIVYGALAAAAVGKVLGVDGEDVLRGLAEYRPVGGRANVTDTGYITLIDDCYNANPNSMAAAIRSLSSIRSLSAAPHGNRVAILGDMKELGADSGELHRTIGVLAAKRGIDVLVAIGEEAKAIYDGYAAEKGNKARYYRTKEELYPDLDRVIGRGDVVLVKASHSMAFEEIVSRLKYLGR